MYVPPAFRNDDPEFLHALMRAHGFALLVTAGPDGLVATHLPLLLDTARGPHGTLLGHMARANPQWRAFAAGAEVLAVFQGAHGYVSPSWYEDRSINVPTWNYAAVHAYGRPRVIEAEAEVKQLLTDLTATYETGPRPWSPAELGPQRFAQLRRAIVAFALPIDRLEGKLKMNQNRTPGDRRGVREALRQRGDAESALLASLVPE
jgi:transcriptional regulator